MKKTLTLLFSSLLLISCGETQKNSEEKKQYDEKISAILSVHDEVMPQMGKLSSLIEKTEARIDTTEVGIKFERANRRLIKAHDLMMSWMKEFGEQFPNALKDTTYSKEEYKKREQMVKEEMREVEEMKNVVEASIKEAEYLISSSTKDEL